VLDGECEHFDTGLVVDHGRVAGERDFVNRDIEMFALEHGVGAVRQIVGVHAAHAIDHGGSSGRSPNFEMGLAAEQKPGSEPESGPSMWSL
jgi:hypothetical protein